MVRYIDRPDLPAPILSALSDPYYMESLAEHFEDMPEKLRKRYRDHFSATTLVKAPRQFQLYKRHSRELILDPLGGYWKMFGHVVHAILEKYPPPGAEVESRNGAEIKAGNKVLYVHGQADIYCAGSIDDYKVTSAESFLYGTRDEHEKQLNILAWVWRKNGKPVSRLRNIYLLRNWRSMMVKEGSLYPKEQIVTVEQKLWSDAEAEAWIKDRAALHWKSEKLPDDELPECSPAERWEREPLHKVFKIDTKTGEMQKVAKFKARTIPECDDWIMQNKVDDKGRTHSFAVKTLPGGAAKCEICEVAPWCSQRKAMLASQQQEDCHEDS